MNINYQHLNLICKNFSDTQKKNVIGWYNLYSKKYKKWNEEPLCFDHWLFGYDDFPEVLKSMSFDNSYKKEL